MLGSFCLQFDSSVFEIEFSVVLADFTEDVTRISDGDDVCGDILCDNVSGSDHGIISDRDARKDDHSRAEPAVASDMHRHIVLIGFFTQLGQDRMTCRCDRDVETEHRVISDVDVCVINKCRTEVAVDILTEVDVASAPIRMKRRLNIAPSPISANISERSSFRFSGSLGRVIL